MEKLDCSVCLETFVLEDKARRRNRALLHCCNHLICVECVKCLLDGHTLRNYWTGAIQYLSCPLCRNQFYRYCALNRQNNEIIEEFVLPGYTTSPANNLSKWQGILMAHKRFGYQTGGLELSRGDSMNVEAAKTIAASIRQRIARTKPRSGSGTSPEWVKGLNDLLEAVIFLSPQFAIYHSADRCLILKEIHIDPVLAEEQERNSAAARQREILQELAEKKERERQHAAHHIARYGKETRYDDDRLAASEKSCPGNKKSSTKESSTEKSCSEKKLSRKQHQRRKWQGREDEMQVSFMYLYFILHMFWCVSFRMCMLS